MKTQCATSFKANARDEFRILKRMRILICISACIPIAGTIVAFFYLLLDGKSLLGALTLAGIIFVACSPMFLYSLIRFLRWFPFRVVISDECLTACNRVMRWEDVVKAEAQGAFGFDWFLKFYFRDGTTLKIPANMEDNRLLLSLCMAHLPVPLTRV